MIATPLYLNAFLPDGARGKGGALMMISFGLGALMEYVAGYADPIVAYQQWQVTDGWRVPLGIYGIIPLTRIILLTFWQKENCPDDKIAKGKTYAALHIVQHCHGPSIAQQRYDQLVARHEAVSHRRPKFKHLFKDQKKLAFLTVIFAVVWNFTGFPYLMSWTILLFGISLYPYQAMVIGNVTSFNANLMQNYCVLFGGLIFVSAIIAGTLVDKMGRKYLTLIGLFVCFAAMLAIGVIGYTQKESIGGVNMLNGNFDSLATVSLYCIWAAGFGTFNVGAYTFLLDLLPRKGWSLFLSVFFVICFFLQLTAWDVYFNTTTAVNPSIFNGTSTMGIFCAAIVGVLYGPLVYLMKETKDLKHEDVQALYGINIQVKTSGQIPAKI